MIGMEQSMSILEIGCLLVALGALAVLWAAVKVLGLIAQKHSDTIQKLTETRVGADCVRNRRQADVVVGALADRIADRKPILDALREESIPTEHVHFESESASSTEQLGAA